MDDRGRTPAGRQAADDTGTGEERRPIPRQADADAYPLSPAQRGVWLLQQLDPADSSFNAAAAFSLSGRLDRPALAAALAALVRRHETLRTTFPPARQVPVQRIVEDFAPRLALCDLAGLEPAQRRSRLARLLDESAQAPFDLREPPWRALLLRLEASSHVLLLVFHHLVADARSGRLACDDLWQLYRAAAESGRAALPALPIRYVDYAAWCDRRFADGAAATADERYWLDRLASPPPALELPADHLQPQRPEGGCRRDVLRVEAAVAEALRAAGGGCGATALMPRLAVFLAFLSGLTGEQDLAVGMPAAGRDHPDVERLVGPFVNLVVARADLGGDPTFLDVVARVRRTILEAFSHAAFPFDLLVDRLHPDRDVDRLPLVQAIFDAEPLSLDLRLEAAGLRVRSHGASALARPSGPAGTPRASRHRARVELELTHLDETDGGFSWALDYRADRFEAATCRRLTSRLERLLRQVAARPGSRLSAIDPLAPHERHQVLVELNQGAPASRAAAAAAGVAGGRRAPDRLVPGAIADRCAERPDAVAAACGERQITYAELHVRAERLARWLGARGVGREDRIGLFGERGLGMLSTLLGVLRAGASFVPLDPEHPDARLRGLLDGAAIAWIATQGTMAARALELAAAVSPRPGVLCWDRGPEGLAFPGPSELAAAADGVPAPEIDPRDLANVFFTSGSTGLPKGAMIEHGGMLNHLRAKIDLLDLDGSSVVAQNASHCFDVSVWQTLAPLLAGGRVVIYDRETALDAPRLLRALARDGVTVLETVPTLLETLLDALAEAEPEAARLPALRQLISNAETLPVPLAARWSRRFPDKVLINTYGATECSDDTTHAIVAPPSPATPRIAVGRPVRGLRMHVLDGWLRPVPAGFPGQLAMAGVGVGRGYLGAPELTAAAFVPDPHGAAGERLYLSGDLGRWSEGGELEFLGRLDHQVKLRGQRIEPAEVEAALSLHPAVRQAVAVVRPQAGGRDRLTAYWVGDPMPPADLRAFLRGVLPRSMVPDSLVHLRAMPLTRNGKIDRHALPEARPEAGGAGSGGPRDTVELAVARLVKAELRVAAVGVADDFFELGGNSLQVVSVAASLEARFGVRPPLRALFDAPTVTAWSRLIRDRLRRAERRPAQWPPRPGLRR